MLEVETFTPDFRDPRRARRVAEVLSWCDLHLHPVRETRVHSRELQRIFGNRSQPLAIWLRANLLRQVGDYTPGVLSSAYLLNIDGFHKLRAACSTVHDVSGDDREDANTRSSAARAGLTDEANTRSCGERRSEANIMNSAAHGGALCDGVPLFPADYELKSNRYWHPAQRIRREKKKQYWRDVLPFDYDISACGPNVLFQLASKFGFLPVLSAGVCDYLMNAEMYRHRVMELAEIEYEDAKTLLTSLFNGAPLSYNRRHATFMLAGSDTVKMARLKRDPQLTSLRSSIKAMWNLLHRSMKFRSRWQLYFTCERKIVECVARCCARHGVQVFMEHDGWRTDRPIDVLELEAEILKVTGFKLTVKEKT